MPTLAQDHSRKSESARGLWTFLDLLFFPLLEPGVQYTFLLIICRIVLAETRRYCHLQRRRPQVSPTIFGTLSSGQGLVTGKRGVAQKRAILNEVIEANAWEDGYLIVDRVQHLNLPAMFCTSHVKNNGQVCCETAGSQKNSPTHCDSYPCCA